MRTDFLTAVSLLAGLFLTGCDTVRVTDMVVDMDRECRGYYTVRRDKSYWKEYERHHCSNEDDEYPNGRRAADLANGWCIMAHCDADLLYDDPDIEDCSALPGCCEADPNDYPRCEDSEPNPYM